MRFCAILILSVISILNSLELKSQTVVNILTHIAATRYVTP